MSSRIVPIPSRTEIMNSENYKNTMKKFENADKKYMEIKKQVRDAIEILNNKMSNTNDPKIKGILKNKIEEQNLINESAYEEYKKYVNEIYKLKAQIELTKSQGPYNTSSNKLFSSSIRTHPTLKVPTLTQAWAENPIVHSHTQTPRKINYVNPINSGGRRRKTRKLRRRKAKKARKTHYKKK